METLTKNTEKKFFWEITEKEYQLIQDYKEFKNNQIECACPVCNAKSKIYKRQFDETYVYFLISLVHLFQTDYQGSVNIHYSKVIEQCEKEFGKRITDYSLISKWNLIESENGMIRLSKFGFKFMKNQVFISETLYIRNNTIVSESDKKIKIEDLIKN
jgi:hypothetical protein